MMEMARCMLHEELLKKFWAKAANITVFLQNRLPTKALEGKIPFDTWYWYKLSLSFLKIIGYVCFAHVPHVQGYFQTFIKDVMQQYVNFLAVKKHLKT